MKSNIDEWAPSMYTVLIDGGIKPWEFGELTFPWLKMIRDKGKIEETPEAIEWQVRQARAITKEFVSKTPEVFNRKTC